MRAILVTLLLIAIAFAGCSSKGGGGDDDGDGTGTGTASGTKTGSGSKSGTGTSSSSGSSSGAPGANRAPTAQLAASVASGAAPLRVNFTLNGTDADGDAMSWTLKFGDAAADATGTLLPKTVSHNYTAVGVYNATLTVTDGKLSVNETVKLNITAATLAGTVFTGTTATPCPDCSGGTIEDPVAIPITTYFCESFAMDEPGGDCIWFELPAGSAGKAFTATSTGGDPDILFTDTCARTHNAGQGFAAVGPEAGTVPASMGCVYIWEWEDVNDSTHTFTVAV